MTAIRGLKGTTGRRRSRSGGERRVTFAAAVLGLACLTAGARVASAQECGVVLGSETQAPATVLRKTADLDVGISGVFENGVTDITYSPDFGGIVLTTDPFEADRVTVFSADLDQKQGFITPDTAGPVYAIAQLVNAPEDGQFYFLDPGFPAVAGGAMQPAIGVMNAEGFIVSPPVLITGLNDPDFVITAMDAHPEGLELVVYGSSRNLRDEITEFYLLNPGFQVTGGPFPTVGGSALTSTNGAGRSGICYNSCESVLIVSSFRNVFDAAVAMEYSTTSGEYTGRAVSLKDLPVLDNEVLAMGIDVGEVDGENVLHVYSANDDALYAVALEYSVLPGRVTQLFCERLLGVDGPLTLTWENDPLADYDSIVIRQDGVVIAMLPPDRTNFDVAPEAAFGFHEYAVELRKDDEPNVIRTYCSDTSSPAPLFNGGSPGGYIDDGVDGSLFFLGLDATPVVTDLADFRVYVLWTADSTVRTLDSNMNGFVEFIPLDLEGDILQVTGLAVIETDGVQRFAVLGTNTASQPAASVHEADGTPIQVISPIDLSQLEGPVDGVFLTDWDSDADGNLIAMDVGRSRLVKILYDPVGGTMEAVQEALVPQCDFMPCEDGGPLPLAGGVTVLPNGNYLVSGGDAFDSTIARAFLATPFVDGSPESSVRFTGYSQGLFPFHLIYIQRLFGHGVGPALSVGLAATHFEYTDAVQNEVEENISFFTLPGFGPVTESWLLTLEGASSDPDLAIEQLEDAQFTGGGQTGELRPGFASRLEDGATVDYFYYVVNRGEETASVELDVVLGGQPEPDATESLTLPPGRYVQRTLFERDERSIELSIGDGDGGSTIQIIAGARGIVSEGPVGPVFIRGDVDANGVFEITDPVNNLNYQFLSTFSPRCLDALDFDNNGIVEITDPVLNLGFQFLGDPPPPPPYPGCGPDPTADDLTCEDYPLSSCP